jgi:phospholipid/cholesterol/gamma-HCH transport system permease protein
VERSGSTATVRPSGDLIVATAGEFYGCLHGIAHRRAIRGAVVDLSGAGRLDSAGVAALSLGARVMERAGKSFTLSGLADHQRAALELLPAAGPVRRDRTRSPGPVEWVGAGVLSVIDRGRALVGLVADTGRESIAVAARRRRLPRGAVLEQAARMGADGVPIIALLAFLLGMTLAFQASVQLHRFGADVFVADLVGVAMVREFGPLIAAIILTGRTGAAIAAELGTMQVREEVDALRVMGISPVRFLVVPRAVALTAVGPALALLAMFVGLLGGLVIAVFHMDLAPITFWARITERVTMGDFGHGLAKSVVFAWMIALSGSFTGLRARGDAASVGVATTRAVVAGLFLIIVVDSAFATASTLGGYQWF